MIVLRRLGGQLIALNPDLIERVEATPDTVVTMVDEKKFLIEESLDEVLELITDYRAYVIARSRELEVSNDRPSGRPVLHVVPGELVASRSVTESDRVDTDSGFGERISGDAEPGTGVGTGWPGRSD